MAISRVGRLTLVFVVSTLLAVCLWWLANSSPGAVQADATGTLFVAPAGSGTACAQAAPCTLQTAAAQAQEGDVVYLGAGSYVGVDAGAVVTVTRGYTLYGGWDGAATGPVQREPGLYHSVVDGQSVRQGIHISGTFSAGIDGLTITSGKAQQGGGIYVQSASVWIRNNVITACQTITYTSWEYGTGGGICLGRAARGVVTNNLIANNTSGYGGGIYKEYSSDSTIEDNDIRGNVAFERGGGLIIANGADIIRRNRLTGNSAAGDGGGVTLWNSAATVEGNRLVNNLAPSGAGLSLGNGCAASLVNNWIIQSSGDGIDVSSSSPHILNNTIVGSASQGTAKGIWLYARAAPSPGYTMINEIINNIVMGFSQGIGGSGALTPTLDYNDVWNNTTAYALPAHVATGAHSISADPRFVSPASADYHLLADSPCINAGDPSGVPPAPPADIDGDPRPLGGRVDIGADEFAGFWQVVLPLVRR